MENVGFASALKSIGLRSGSGRTAALIWGGLLALGFSAVLQAAERPDFSGVYRNYRGQGIGAMAPMPALTAQAQAKVDEVSFILEGTGETSGGWCLGSGMPGSMMGSGAYPMEIIQRPEQITVIYEAHTEIRRIYIGDDNQMGEADKFPDRNGYSKGWWEGDVLVVETDHLKEQADGRYPHSADARITERYHVEKDDDGNTVLVAEVSMVDPAYYKETATMEKRWLRDPKAKMLPYECSEPNWEARLLELREQKLK